MSETDLVPSIPEVEITALLEAWNQGQPRALDCLVPVVYQELQKLAHAILRCERPDHTLRATALVHETYLRLVDYRHPHWKNRTHFFGAAANLMRRVLVDHARRRQAAKRDGGLHASAGHLSAPTLSEVDLIGVDAALEKLAAIDPQQARVVELRFFGGLSNEETAEAMQVSLATVKRDWSSAKVWLYHRLREP